MTAIGDPEGRCYGLYIGGEWSAPRSGRSLESFDPSTGEPWYRLADADARDVDRAVAAARGALRDRAWRGLTQTARGERVARLAGLIAGQAEAFAHIETRDNGKLLREMRAQAAYLPAVYRYFAGMADKIELFVEEVMPHFRRAGDRS